MSATESKVSADRDTVKRWADEHDAVPVRTARSPGDADVDLLPERDVTDTQERASWDEFFEELERENEVVIYTEADEDPFVVTHQADAATRSDTEREEIEQALLEGDTVTTEITETAVVESVVTEEITVESELVDSEVLDQHVVDVELIDRECTNCDVFADAGEGDATGFDEGHYFDVLGDERRAGIEDSDEQRSLRASPYTAEIDVREAWDVTRERLERYTVESTIADTDVDVIDKIDDRDVVVEDVQRHVAESDLLRANLDPDDVVSRADVESEFTEDNTVRTTFSRRTVTEDEVVGSKHLEADVTSASVIDLDVAASTRIESEFTDDEGLQPVARGSTTDAGATGEMSTTTEGTEAFALDEGDAGKTIVDASGEEIGMVTEVDEDGGLLYADPHPGIGERIKAALGWGSKDDGDHTILAKDVARVENDRIELKEEEHLPDRDS